MERPDCMRCRSYYVTWNAQRPRGCRAFGFVTSELPSRVVRESSGRECELFERREPAHRQR